MSLATLLLSPLPSPHYSPWHFPVTSWTLYSNSGVAVPQLLYILTLNRERRSLFRSPAYSFRPHPDFALPPLSFTLHSLIVKSTLYSLGHLPFLPCQQSFL